MKFIKQKVAGVLIDDGERVVLRLEGGDDAPPVYVAFALVTQGIAAQVVPAVLLDDWGKEIKGLALYDWVRENGWRFPRAELFGVTPFGEQTQYFLRDMELLAPFPAYATLDRTLPIQSWRPLRAALVVDDALDASRPTGVPPAINGPLGHAALAWWRVPAGVIDLSFLDDPTPAVE